MRYTEMIANILDIVPKDKNIDLGNGLRIRYSSKTNIEGLTVWMGKEILWSIDRYELTSANSSERGFFELLKLMIKLNQKGDK